MAHAVKDEMCVLIRWKFFRSEFFKSYIMGARYMVFSKERLEITVVHMKVGFAELVINFRGRHLRYILAPEVFTRKSQVVESSPDQTADDLYDHPTLTKSEAAFAVPSTRRELCLPKPRRVKRNMALDDPPFEEKAGAYAGEAWTRVPLCGYSADRPLAEVWETLLLGPNSPAPTQVQGEQDSASGGTGSTRR
jgi:hypothetical protein